ncbi:MAG: nuclear transport factor 2 family protein [Flammeovirgaceae bacterium]|nr:nuclear transport factor 2 family protein [Flammeovirgaceae bacterium]
MKKYSFLVLLSILSFFVSAQTDEELIKQVVNSAYIEGIQNRGSVEDIRKGFHPAFVMQRFIENDARPLGIEEWITNNEKAKAQNPTAGPRAEGKFLSVDVAGSAAVVKLELYRDGKKTFTDYLSLYKFQEGWRIVAKIYYRQP